MSASSIKSLQDILDRRDLAALKKLQESDAIPAELLDGMISTLASDKNSLKTFMLSTQLAYNSFKNDCELGSLKCQEIFNKFDKSFTKFSLWLFADDNLANREAESNYAKNMYTDTDKAIKSRRDQILGIDDIIPKPVAKTQTNEKSETKMNTSQNNKIVTIQEQLAKIKETLSSGINNQSQLLEDYAVTLKKTIFLLKDNKSSLFDTSEILNVTDADKNKLIKECGFYLEIANEAIEIANSASIRFSTLQQRLNLKNQNTLDLSVEAEFSKNCLGLAEGMLNSEDTINFINQIPQDAINLRFADSSLSSKYENFEASVLSLYNNDDILNMKQLCSEFSQDFEAFSDNPYMFKNLETSISQKYETSPELESDIEELNSITDEPFLSSER